MDLPIINDLETQAKEISDDVAFLQLGMNDHNKLKEDAISFSAWYDLGQTTNQRAFNRLSDDIKQYYAATYAGIQAMISTSR